MAPKRPAEAVSGSASDASDAEAEAEAVRRASSPSPSKTPPPMPNPNPKSPAPAAAPADSAAAGSDSVAASDSDADARPAAPRPASPKPRNPRARSRSRSRSPGMNSDSENSPPPAASDAEADPAAGADSDDDNASPPRLPPPRPSRAEATVIKPISSRPMDPPRRSGAASESRAKRPRTAAVTSSVEHTRRPSRVWSPRDELVILRGLSAYRTKRGVLPGSTHDIGKLHGDIRSQLSAKVSVTQLSDKVRRLKQKFQLLATRAKTGRDPEFPTQHDHSLYELGKKVWETMSSVVDADGGGGYDNAGGGESEEDQYSGESDDMEIGRDNHARKNRRLKPVSMANGNGIVVAAVNADVRGRSEFEKGKDAYPYLWETVEELSREHPSGVAFKKSFEVLEGSKARVMEEKLRKFRLAEMRQQLRRMDLMKETVTMVLDALEMAD